MKISKAKVRACDDTQQAIFGEEPEQLLASPYEEAKSCIMQAIEGLSSLAETDQSAKDAIANLSVIYFELQ